jgi:hypothetical protein
VTFMVVTFAFVAVTFVVTSAFDAKRLPWT